MKKKNVKDKQKKIVASIIALLIVFIMVFGLIAPFAFGAQNVEEDKTQDIQISGKIGFDKKYKLNHHTPFKVNITNNGEDFNGKVQIKINISPESKVKKYNIYSKKISLPKGSSKLVEMDIPLSILKASHKIVLVDETGKEAAAKTLYCSGIDPYSTMMGVLTDNKESLNYLKQLELNKNAGNSSDNKMNDKLIFLDEKIFPKSVETLEAFNIIIIDDFDTKKLTNTQMDSIDKWLEKGGILVLGAGSSYDKVFKNIGTNVVKLENKGTIEVTDLSSIGYYKPQTANTQTIGVEGEKEQYKAEMTINLSSPEGKPITINDLTVENSMKQVNKQGQAFSYLTEKGKGAVIVHPYGLGLEPFISLEGRNRFLTNTYVGEIEERFEKKNEVLSSLTHLTSNLPYLSDSSIFVIFAIVIAYCIFIGPILYLILKYKDKREKGFIVIPIVAVTVTIIIYFIGSGNIYKKPIINTISFIEFENGSKTAVAASNVGALTPEKGDINVTFSKDSGVLLNNTSNVYMYNRMSPPMGRESDIAEIFTDDTANIRFFNKSAWDNNNYLTNNKVSLKDGLQCDLYLDGLVLKGTITNNTGLALENLIVGIGTSLKKYGTITHGQTIDINQTMDLESKFDIYVVVNDILFDNNSMAKMTTEEIRNKHLMQQILLSIVSDEYAPGIAKPAMPAGYYGSGVVSGQPVTMGKSFFTQYNTNSLMDVSIYAFNFDKLSDSQVKINGVTPTEINTNVLKANVPLDIYNMEKFDLPFGSIIFSTIEASVPVNHSDNSDEIYVSVLGNVKFTFNMKVSENIDLFQIRWLIKAGQQEIYNVTDNVWEPLKTEPYEQNHQSYIDKDGNINVRVNNVEAGALPVPQIRVKGGK